LHPQWQESLNQEAWVRATHLDPKKRNGNLALLLAREICQATRNGDPRFLDTLAAAYAEIGQFARAVETARQAIAAIPSGQQEDFVRALRVRLEGYERGQPFRSAADSAAK